MPASPLDDPARPDHDARVLITAGPTHEPIDAVRFIGNRSPGRVGVTLAERACDRGWSATLLLGPTPVQPTDTRVDVHRFRTAAELQGLLDEHLAPTNVLVMAAAVADYRPRGDETSVQGKRRRTDQPMTLELEPTPDLLAACAARRRPDQLLVGFALEPRAELMESARRKLERKSIDMVVANPLETMDSDRIEAWIVSRADLGLDPHLATQGPIPKSEFADWLLSVIARARESRRTASTE